MQRFRNWCYTLNNPTEEELFYLDNLVENEEDVIYHVYQIEEAATLHAQGYVELATPFNLSKMKILVGERVHLESKKGTRVQARDYCMKAETRKEGPFEYGTWRIQGRRIDLDFFRNNILNHHLTEIEILTNDINTYAKHMRLYGRLKQIELREISKENFRNKIIPKVTVLIGKPGVGKTRYVFDNHDLDDIYVWSGGDGTQGSIWFDDYQGERIMLIDDYYGNIPYAFLLRLADMYPMRLQTKGGYTYKCFTHIYITSNMSPQEWYPRKNINALLRRITKILTLDQQPLIKSDGFLKNG